MIFWAALAILVLASIYIFLEYWGETMDVVMGLILTWLLGGGLAALAILMCGSLIPWNNDLVGERTHQLKALGTTSGIEGRAYFLGGGYINGERVLNYITTREGGAIKVEQSDADVSTIYEGASGNTVTVRHYDHINGWVVPWPLGDHDEYEFRIPTGSVGESYTVDNK